MANPRPRVALITLGCGRNDVDSEELAGRLAADGFAVTDSAVGADAVVVNTCGFVAEAKKDSIDTLLAAAGHAVPVLAAGCLAERYGAELAAELPEAAAVLSFDDYPEIGDRVRDALAGRAHVPHVPSDRRRLLPISPAQRPAATGPGGFAIPGAPERPGPGVVRQRLSGGPVAALKLASGCDRRCAFCAIPRFRGAYVSRLPDDVLAEAEWLAARGVRELVLVSENSTSYGKDLGDLRALEALLPQLAAVAGVVRVRVAYLQPAEMRPSLIEVLTTTPGVARYADLSFQHASAPLLRRMRRFGGTERFLELLAALRERAPELGARSNVIVGFPGETPQDVAELVRFLEAAELDAVGVFGYSDEDGTEAAGLPGKVTAPTIRRRLARLTAVAEELTSQRAERRIGTDVEVLVEQVRGTTATGRAEHQAPEVDGSTTVRLATTAVRVGDLVTARVVATEGVDLVTDLLAVGGTADPRSVAGQDRRASPSALPA